LISLERLLILSRFNIVLDSFLAVPTDHSKVFSPYKSSCI
jgi:hypothetical protein